MDVIDATSPAPRAVWLAMLRADSWALAFQTPAWSDCVCEIDGYEDASQLYELKGGRQLILPLVRRARWANALATEASLPYGWGFGGLVAAGPIGGDEVAAVFSDLARRTRLCISVRPNPLLATTWSATAPLGAAVAHRRAHVLDLDGGFDRIWTERFVGTARTAVRKAERSSLLVECDTTGKLVPVFYDLYLRSIDRWAEQDGAPRGVARWRRPRPEPPGKLHLVAKRLGDTCQVWVAWLDGRPAAAIVVLRQGENASYWRGAMDKDVAGPSRANYLLHRLAIEDACRAGCRFYHMGDTGQSHSLAQFKTRFGARAHDYCEYRLQRFPITQTLDRLGHLVQHVRHVGLPPASSSRRWWGTPAEGG